MMFFRTSKSRKIGDFANFPPLADLSNHFTLLLHFFAPHWQVAKQWQHRKAVWFENFFPCFEMEDRSASPFTRIRTGPDTFFCWKKPIRLTSIKLWKLCNDIMSFFSHPHYANIFDCDHTFWYKSYYKRCYILYTSTFHILEMNALIQVSAFT